MPRLFDTEQIFKEAHPDLINLGIHIAQDDLRYDYEELLYNLKHLEKTAPKKYISLIRQMARDDFFFFCYTVDIVLFRPLLWSLSKKQKQKNWTQCFYKRNRKVP